MEKGRKRERERERCGSTFAPPLHLHFVIKPRKQVTGLPYVLRTYVLQFFSRLALHWRTRNIYYIAFPLNTLPICILFLFSYLARGGLFRDPFPGRNGLDENGSVESGIFPPRVSLAGRFMLNPISEFRPSAGIDEQ